MPKSRVGLHFHWSLSEFHLLMVEEYVAKYASKEAADDAGEDSEDDDEMSSVGSYDSADDEEPAGTMDEV